MRPKPARIPVMTFQSKALGQTGETLATKFLETKKLQILHRNLRTNYGEIDILARDGRALVIVEVKAKTDAHRGAAIEMITPAKQAKLVLLAHELQAKYQTPNVRIDVVTVDEAENQPRLRHYKAVIEASNG